MGTSQPQWQVRSKHTFKMRNSYATDELAWAFVTGPTDTSTKLSEFYCQIWQKDVCIVTLQRTSFSGDPAFREGSKPPPWDSWMACPWFWWQASDRRWAGEALRQISEGSLSCSEQRVPVPRGLDSGCFRKRWSSTSSVGKGFIPHQCAPTEWELRTGWASLGAICLDGQPGKCQHCLVAQWSFG